MQVIMDSTPDEKIYGLGLQYTETNFKGSIVHMISSEGGVGRGLKPLTDMLNTENNGQGGSKFTTYSPAYSFATSEFKGVIFNNHTEIGSIDFRRLNSITTTLWKAKEIHMTYFEGSSLKNAV